MANEFIVKNGLITPNFINAGLTYPTADGTPGQVIETDGSGNLSFATPAAGGGGGGVQERIKLNYTTTGAFDSFSSSTAGVLATNVTNAGAGAVTFEITFTGHAYPPSSILVYGFAQGLVEYTVQQYGTNIQSGIIKIDGEGTEDVPTAFGSFTGPISLQASEADTGSSRAFLKATHAWFLFQFGD